MARCPNKNTVEYKALQEVYKTELKTNNVINFNPFQENLLYFRALKLINGHEG